MNEDKAPTYILNADEDTALVTDVAFSHFWKVKTSDWPLVRKDVQTNVSELPLQPSVCRFFHHPDYSGHHAQDMAIVGVPYNRGSSFAESKVAGFPDSLRLASGRYPVYTQLNTTSTSGLYDLNARRFLFQNLIFRDLGDINESSTQNFERLSDAIRQLTVWSTKQNTRLVAIGGDHSITYSFVRSLAEEIARGIILVDLDAHHDCKTGPIDEEEVHHANFVRHLLDLECVVGIIQVGIRGIRSAGQLLIHPKLLQIPASSVSPGAVRSALRHTLRRVPTSVGYLSIDMDVLDPGHFSRVDFPVTGGLTLEQVTTLIWAIFHSGLPLLGVDLVEGLLGGNTEKNDYDVPLCILAHCLDGICLQRYKPRRKRLLQYIMR